MGDPDVTWTDDAIEDGHFGLDEHGCLLVKDKDALGNPMWRYSSEDLDGDDVWGAEERIIGRELLRRARAGDA